MNREEKPRPLAVDSPIQAISLLEGTVWVLPMGEVQGRAVLSVSYI